MQPQMQPQQQPKSQLALEPARVETDLEVVDGIVFEIAKGVWDLTKLEISEDGKEARMTVARSNLDTTPEKLKAQLKKEEPKMRKRADEQKAEMEKEVKRKMDKLDSFINSDSVKVKK